MTPLEYLAIAVCSFIVLQGVNKIHIHDDAPPLIPTSGVWLLATIWPFTIAAMVLYSLVIVLFGIRNA